CIVFGDLIDGMGGATGGMATMTPEQMTAMMDGMMSQMEELCITMMLVGVGATFAAFLQGAAFKIFSEKQAFKFRVLYFDSVLHQDWFDVGLSESKGYLILGSL
ncbi:ABCB5, partial [Symbiodinium sp. KB8]